MMKKLILIAVLLCAVFASVALFGQTQTLSLKPQNWRLHTAPYATGGKTQWPLALDSAGVLRFSFPTTSQAYANYSYTIQ